jgi:hypothetical protein
MRPRIPRMAGLALLFAAAGLAGNIPAPASCPNPVPFFQGYTSNGYFSGCGDARIHFFYWEHHRAVQGVWGNNVSTTGPSGNDSGALNTIADSVLVPYDRSGRDGAPTPGAYRLVMNSWDWNNVGSDGCIVNKTEPDPSCLHGGTASLPVLDFVVAGSDAGSRLVAKAAVLSVDGNERNQFWILDQAGASSIDGKACGKDAFAFAPAPVTCGLVPVPAVASPPRCDATGCTLDVTVGAASVPLLDDCAVANSRKINCPRKLLSGRGLFVKRAPCDATSPGKVESFDTRSFIMDSGTGLIARNFVPYASQDGNLNGIRDGGEAPHGRLVIEGNGDRTVPVRIPKIAGAADCAYLGVGLILDPAPDPSSCGGACEQVVTPLLSVNAIPFSLATALPVPDRVVSVLTRRSGGKVEISWDTTAEQELSGFNVLGTGKKGGTIRLNQGIIEARKPAGGGGSHYSIVLDASVLKGITTLHVEVVKKGGAREQFGPVGL